MNEYKFGKMFKIINKTFEKNINEKMVNVNITRSQMELLMYTYKNNQKDTEVNQVDIEKALDLKNPTVTGLINRLEKKGYIIRKKSDRGPNCKSIVVTDEGINLLNDGKKVLDDTEKIIFASLDKSEKDELKRLLLKVIEWRNRRIVYLLHRKIHRGALKCSINQFEFYNKYCDGGKI